MFNFIFGRKKTSSNNNGKTLNHIRSFSDMALVDEVVCLSETDIYTDTKRGLKVSRNHLAASVGYSDLQSEITIKIEDEKQQITATRIDNFSGTATNLYLNTKSEQKSQKLESKTEEGRCAEIYSFFKGHNIPKGLLCNTSTDKIEEALRAEGYAITHQAQPKI